VRCTNKAVRVAGVLLKQRDCIRLDRPVEMPSGRVEVTIRPASPERRKRRKELSLLDLAGTGRELFRGIDVDKWLDDMRNEWDREVY
jgi:hypothetical protein